MKRVPSTIRDYLLSIMLEGRSAAYLCADHDWRVLRAGGRLERYDLGALQRGEDASAAAYFLVGNLVLEGAPIVLPRLEVAPSVFADVHLFANKEEYWIVLLDASEEVAEHARTEQALRQAEDHLRGAERMESLGRLAGGIAHDFNNLLTAILGYGEFLIKGLATPDPLYGFVLEIRKAAERGALLIRQLLAFSKRQVTRTSAIDLNEIIKDEIEMLKHMVGEDVRFDFHLEEGIAPVEADRSQMEQVVLNLVLNARDAMPGGGVLTVETRTAKGTESPIGECVVLRFADTGTGMNDETRTRIFEPFFTTKEKGTGLGLSTVYGIVTQNGGEISVQSAPGEGTEFEIRLPRAAESASAPHATTEETARARTEETHIIRAHGEMIMLVEDDELVHRIVHQFLASMDYQVLDAMNAREALELSESHSGPIDLLLTDVVMPQMSGTELAEQLRASRPGLKTLFMSGYSAETIWQRGHAGMHAPFLSKPFTYEQLATAIRAVLDTRVRRQGSAFLQA